MRTWRRLVDALGPDARRLGLRKGASETSIVAAETLMNARFPADYRAWLAIADGQEAGLSILPTGNALLSVDRLLVRWTEERHYDFEDHDDDVEDEDDDLEDDDLDDDVDDLEDDEDAASQDDDLEDDDTGTLTDGGTAPAIHPFLIHPRRITIAGTQLLDYDNTVLDLVPGPTGTSGQVINFARGRGLVLFQPSFDAYLDRVAELVERGALVVHDTDVGLRLDPPGALRRWDDLVMANRTRASRTAPS